MCWKINFGEIFFLNICKWKSQGQCEIKVEKLTLNSIIYKFTNKMVNNIPVYCGVRGAEI